MGVPMWSNAWFLSSARLAAVGLGTGALTGAARAPRRRAAILGLLLVWPLALTALAVSFFARNEGYEPVPSLVGATTLLALVAAAVLLSSAWVRAPLRRAVPGQRR